MSFYTKCLLTLTILFPLIGHSATIYTVDINASNSSVMVDGAETYTIAGTFNVAVDGSDLTLSNIDTATLPINIASELFFVSAITNYDGLNFDYRSDPPEAPVIADIYTGTFDGSILSLSGQTQGSAYFDFDIKANVVSPVPLPGALILFLSGFIGLLGYSVRKTA